VGARSLIYLRRREGAKTGAFRTFLKDELVPALVKTGALRELRTQVFLPWIERLWDTPNVAHDNPTDQRFHASLILGFADPDALRAFFGSGEVATLSGKLPEFVSAVHAYEVTEALTYVKDGRAPALPAITASPTAAGDPPTGDPQQKNVNMPSLAGDRPVTGANGGIGTRPCARLPAARAKVYATARTPRTGTTTHRPAHPRRHRRQVVTAAATMSRPSSAAGANPPSASLLEPRRRTSANMEINFFGPSSWHRPSRPVWPPTRGRSSSACTPSPAGTAGGVSSAAKAALWSATNALRLELAPRGVHGTGVHMGYVETRMAAHADGPKMAPADLVTKVYDAVEANEYEVIGDELTAQVKAALSGPVGALYPGAPRHRDTPAAVEE
jgi:NAD(P)-dependent dehydrogenase (short-subunit alcohol dehydrogenase family)